MSADPVYALPPGTPVLVTGATGFTGRVLVTKLCAAGARVTALARATSDLEPLKNLPIRWLRGDIYDPRVIQNATAEALVIFNLATPYRKGGSSGDNFQRVHVEGTRLLATGAMQTPGFQRFVHVSTVGVHGHVAGDPADENHPFAPGDAYQASKLEAELWVRDFAKREGLPLTVIRPAAIYGPGDRRLLKLFKMAARGYLLLFGYGRSYYHLVHVDDLANVLMLAATHPAAVGEVFICGNPDCTTVPQIGGIIADALGKSLRVIRLPVTPLVVAAVVCEWICRPLGIDPPLHRRRVAFFTKDRLFDTRKLQTRLGYTMTHTAAEGLAETARWYREQGWL